jgi:glycine/D-amino acid oxidase-like deaminating enzyme
VSAAPDGVHKDPPAATLNRAWRAHGRAGGSAAAATYTAAMPLADPLQPLWFATAVEAPDYRAAPVADDYDAIVVGAGVTGLSTALHLAERGTRVLVLERDGPGLGSTGRANGQVIAGLQQPPPKLLKAYGDARGERLVEFSGAAPGLVFGLIRRHGIECEAERSGWIQATRWSRGLRPLEALMREWQRRGAPVRMLDRADIAQRLGTQAYAGGWLDQRNGTIQPLAYARGLAAAAVRAGATLQCGVALQGLVREAGRWRLQTTHGERRAACVVLATNVFTRELAGVARTCLGRTYLSAYSVQLATAPLDAAQLREILPQRHSCGDTEHLRLRYFRLDAGGRFVIGGPGWLRPPRSPDAVSFRILERSARRMFPALAGVPFEFHWAARDSLTPDLVPHLYEPSPGLFSALGYNGRGLAIGTALGTVLARRVLGEAAEALPFPTTASSKVPFNLPAAIRFWLGSARRRFRH